MGPFYEAYKLLEVQRKSTDLSAKGDLSVDTFFEFCKMLVITILWDMTLIQEKRLRRIVLNL